MKLGKILEFIERYFDYLFKEYGFSVISETDFDSFGNWVIVLQSDSSRIRFFQDRGEVSLAVGPLWSPPSWQAGPWYDLSVITTFLSKGQHTFKYELGTTERQLERLTQALHLSCKQICELFQETTYQRIRQELDEYSEQALEQDWNKLLGKEN